MLTDRRRQDDPPALKAADVVRMAAGAEHGGIVAGAIAREIGSWGGPWAGGAFAVMLATSTILAARSRRAGLVMSVVLCMRIGHYCVFQLTLFDPLWLVQTTFYRLLTQLWPLLMVATFVGIQRLGRTARQAQTDLA